MLSIQPFTKPPSERKRAFKRFCTYFVCVSKIKQDGANLAKPKEFEKFLRCLGLFVARAPLV
ncbi:hypothetical protein CGC32_07840 (plasmid) [Helicobacter pylori]|nr:hypothetical protein CGC32_07825 [Helicobacter pylori]ASM64521.1 hypothetical protein CGC32_07840 [Helicobacter pylori]